MSRETFHQAYPLLGFSVAQPALGCPLEFFPAMGTQELDDMINAYIPGPTSMSEKRAAVSMEFFSHTMQTGELFKFFFVYEQASTTTSPASSSGMIDSGYGSSFNASPVLSESQWSQSTSSSSTNARKSSKAASSVSRPQDFSHIPGFSIMTKDGQDVTHSASRGMKTKEQRDHAHLMRVIKACESCRKKKTRCDPSHKKRSSVASAASESSARASKKSKKTTSRTASSISSAKAQSMLTPSPSAPAMAAESLLFDIAGFADEATAESWEQFVQYDEPVAAAAAAPNDWEHFFDTAGYYSPSTSHTDSTPMSPSRVLQTSLPASPAELQYFGGGSGGGVRDPGFSQEPTVPYLNPGGLGSAGSNYVDFNLYSPGSTCLDDDPAFIQDVTATWRGCTTLPLSQCHPSIDRQPESIGTSQCTVPLSQRHPITDRQPESIGTLDALASPSQRHPSVGRQPESIGTSQSTVPVSTRQPSIDRQPESIGTSQPTAPLSTRQPSIDRQPESIGTPQSLASQSQRHPESIGTLQPLANSSALEAFAKNDAPVLKRRSYTQGLATTAGNKMSPHLEVDQIFDGGDMFHKSQSEASERQSPVLNKKHSPGAVSVGMSMSSAQMAAAAHEHRSHGPNGNSGIHGLPIMDVRDDARSHNDAQEANVQHHRQNTVQDRRPAEERRPSSSVDSIALTSGDLGTQNPKPSPAVERARATPLAKISGPDRRDEQVVATEAYHAYSVGKHVGTAACLQSMAALVQGAAILAVMVTFMGQVSSWWSQRESKGPWSATPHALPPVASPPSSERPPSVSGPKSGTKETTTSVSTAPLSSDSAAKPASQLRQAAAVFQKRHKLWTGIAVHRMPLAVMG